MKYELVIVGDTNDADYVTAIHEVTIDELELLYPIIEVIKSNMDGYNWCSSEFCDPHELPHSMYENLLTEEQIDLFNEYTPYGENGIHTIESIVYYSLPEKVKLL